MNGHGEAVIEQELPEVEVSDDDLLAIVGTLGNPSCNVTILALTCGQCPSKLP